MIPILDEKLTTPSKLQRPVSHHLHLHQIQATPSKLQTPVSYHLHLVPELSTPS
jgi:hypothetical protein